MKNKKLLIALSVVLAASLIFMTACSSSNETETETDSTEQIETDSMNENDTENTETDTETETDDTEEAETLSETIDLTANFTDASGAAMANCNIKVSTYDGTAEEYVDTEYTLDENGSITLTALPVGEFFYIYTYDADGNETGVSYIITQQAEETSFENGTEYTYIYFVDGTETLSVDVSVTEDGALSFTEAV